MKNRKKRKKKEKGRAEEKMVECRKSNR